RATYSRNPSEVKAEIERLRLLIREVVKLAHRHTESHDHGEQYFFNARWDRDSKEWQELSEAAKAAGGE
ncbi:unnamed protein product, partial [marine sediment metagenome]